MPLNLSPQIKTSQEFSSQLDNLFTEPVDDFSHFHKQLASGYRNAISFGFNHNAYYRH